MRSKEEKQGCTHNCGVVSSLQSFIASACSIDIPLINSSFTWFGPSNKRGKLDRALVSAEWFQKGEWITQAFHRKHSDHRPLVLKSEMHEWGPRPFKFFNCWLQDSTLAQRLKRCWTNSTATNPQAKFKLLRDEARSWNKVQLGNVDANIQKL